MKSKIPIKRKEERSSKIPVIDLFAGPGGLAEGFSALGKKNGKKHFKVALSVENDASAHSTLLLRSFFRQFHPKKVPAEYYSFLRNELSLKDLYEKYPGQAISAQNETWFDELGSGDEFNRKLDNKIKDIIFSKKKWVLIGGPPCQAYSIAGRSRNKGKNGYKPEKDNRHFLYREYLRILAEHKPPVVVMENVKGLLSSRVHNKFIFEKIISDLKKPSVNGSDSSDLEYEIFSLVSGKIDYDQLGRVLNPGNFVIKSEDYGIPQSRHRVILLGIRKDLIKNNITPGRLKKTKHIPISKILKGLPHLRSGLSLREKVSDSKAAWKQSIESTLNQNWLTNKDLDKNLREHILRRLKYIRIPHKDKGGEYIKYKAKIKYRPKWFLDPRIKGVCNYSSRNHIVKDLHRYFFSSCYSEVNGNSPTLNKYPRELLPAHRNANSGDFDDRFRVQVWNRPATTITSHISKDGHYYIHPDPVQCRSLTVREAARIQTFPDNYFFMGNRTEQYRQVGNAVPPLLSFQIAKIVYNLLKKSK